MTVVSNQQLSKDMQAKAHLLINQVGLMPQAQDRPLEADDLLFYISETTMPMAAFLQNHGLFMDDQGLHFDFSQFDAIREVAVKVVAEHDAGKLDGVWKQFDLSTDDDADYNGEYILLALAALAIMYGQGN
ncbi:MULTISPECIES: hypothetical protein [Bradyrhizobium]|uniref:DUF3768 domain-containing protein n=1 Tax=Bradyrhizobium brasilense TaxID=1419277 RepID=A0ABY8JFS7_9BRAD|nr:MULTISPECIES: hypothetical protein [Bradyrhizobium]MCP1910414.1 hypothetical protein [Bradyrhizobium elkanii]MCC8945262.1 hypothetical protein [Bradyrhizobium brasilense]MCP1836359.1 hypothetical protein [Bradyrhizobium sp. USDA 4545]MCP1846426.1 hypothetical protein [Bradyrhizobium sp. USDA 4541]MCP1921108.1 hypothetical protein [Bradyrhizobium sp. USDA 4532]